MSYQAFQWPEFDVIEGYHLRDFPDWLVQAATAGNVRVKDDLAHVRGPNGEDTVYPGDWIIRAGDGCLFVANDELFRTLSTDAEGSVSPADANSDNADAEGGVPQVEGADAEGGVPDTGPHPQDARI